MKTIKNFLWSLLPVLCLAFAVSCDTDPQVDGKEDVPAVEKDSTIVLGKDVVNAGLDGGTYVLEYSITNPHQGEKISAKASADWVSDFNTNISGALSMKVAPNTSDNARECIVTVKYRYAKDVAFVVKQGAKINQGFTLENVQADYFSYTVDVIPDDKTASFIVMSAHPEYVIASEFKTGKDFYEDDVLYFGWLGQFYGMTATQIMQERSKIGDQRGIEVKNGAPGTPYTFYCYYIDYESGTLLSEVQTFTVKTKKPELVSAEFKMDYTVDTCVVSADVTPVGSLPAESNGNYYFDALNVELINSYLNDLVEFKTGNAYFQNVQEVVEYYWCNAVATMMNDLSVTDIINGYTCAGENPDGTPKSQYDFELLANSDYYIFAFAMNDMALCMSIPQCVKVHTESVPMSDNVITPLASKITQTTAHISFTTTNDDYYIAGWEKASDWATYGNNDAERQEYLLKNLSYEFIQGDYEQSVIGLEGGTDYILYAFGSRGGVATTSQIFTYPFSTKSTAYGSATIEFVDNGYYAAADLAELPGWEFFGGDYYSGALILPVEYHIEGEWQSFFGSVYNWTDRYDLYNDAQYRDGLVWSINEYGSMTLQKSYCILESDSFYIVAALVIDKDGFYSPITKFEITTSYDGARTNAQDFADWWNGKTEGPGLSSAAADYRPIFSKKVKANKVSEMNLNAEQKAVAHDEMVIRR